MYREIMFVAIFFNGDMGHLSVNGKTATVCNVTHN